jgi:hypothetical protein
VLGNYEAMDESLVTIEKFVRASMNQIPPITPKKQADTLQSYFQAPLFGWPAIATNIVADFRHYKSMYHLVDSLERSAKHYNSLFNTMTMRGIVALEAGETQRARDIFEAVLKEAGTEHPFADRRIAQRYLELLNESR